MAERDLDLFEALRATDTVERQHTAEKRYLRYAVLLARSAGWREEQVTREANYVELRLRKSSLFPEYRHLCRRDCRWASLDRGAPIFDPFDRTNPASKATGAVFVCRQSGHAHVCGQGYCQRYIPQTNGEFACPISGFWAGTVVCTSRRYGRNSSQYQQQDAGRGGEHGDGEEEAGAAPHPEEDEEAAENDEENNSGEAGTLAHSAPVTEVDNRAVTKSAKKKPAARRAVVRAPRDANARLLFGEPNESERAAEQQRSEAGTGGAPPVPSNGATLVAQLSASERAKKLQRRGALAASLANVSLGQPDEAANPPPQPQQKRTKRVRNHQIADRSIEALQNSRRARGDEGAGTPSKRVTREEFEAMSRLGSGALGKSAQSAPGAASSRAEEEDQRYGGKALQAAFQQITSDMHVQVLNAVKEHLKTSISEAKLQEACLAAVREAQAAADRYFDSERAEGRVPERFRVYAIYMEAHQRVLGRVFAMYLSPWDATRAPDYFTRCVLLIWKMISTIPPPPTDRQLLGGEEPEGGVAATQRTPTGTPSVATGVFKISKMILPILYQMRAGVRDEVYYDPTTRRVVSRESAPHSPVPLRCERITYVPAHQYLLLLPDEKQRASRKDKIFRTQRDIKTRFKTLTLCGLSIDTVRRYQLALYVKLDFVNPDVARDAARSAQSALARSPH